MFELPPKRKRGRSPDAKPLPRGLHKRGRRIVSLLATLERADALAGSEAESYAAALLGVPGLTRQALDSCVAAFFGGLRHTVRLSQSPDLFLRRIRVMLYETAGLEVPKDLMGIEAAGEFLALAVALLGAPGSPYAALEGPLRERCVEIAGDAEYLADGGVDVVEAANILAEGSLYSTGRSHLSASNPVTLDPLGRAYPAELAMYHGIHIRAPGPDAARREAVFWGVWAADAIRSTCIGAQAVLNETDVGWPYPGGGDDPAMPLALVGRHISANLLSVRARCTGLAKEDVRKAVNELDALAWGNDNHLKWLREQVASPDVTVPATLVILAARNLMYVVCWAAAKCDATQHPRNLSARTLELAEAGAVRGAEHMAELAHTIVENKIPAPALVATRAVSVIVFLIHRVAEHTTRGKGKHRGSELAGTAEALITTMGSMERYTDTPGVVSALRDALVRAQDLEVEAEARAALVRDLVGLLVQHEIQTPFGELEI